VVKEKNEQKMEAKKHKSIPVLGPPISEPKTLEDVDKEKFEPVFYQYNAMQPGPVITAKPGVKIETSMDQDFKSIYSRHVADAKGEVLIPNPPPGDFYWRVEGDKSTNKIRIGEAPTTELTLAENQNPLAEGSLLQWKANANASYFKLEFSDNEKFTGPIKVFSTKYPSFNSKLLGKGNWFVRISALNIKRGTYESLPEFSVQIQ
jgi:hypothetical protein